MSRAHLYLPILDSSGTVFPFASITVNNADGSTLDTAAYVQSTGGNPVEFPLFADPAVVDIYLDDAARVQIVAEISSNVRIVVDGIDVLPEPPRIMQAPDLLTVTGAASPVVQGVLMSAAPGEAAFRVVDPVGTHQHEGDSPGSVVLTGEAPTDYNPYQTWIGHHAGESTGTSTAGSSALGDQTVLNGTAATLLGSGQITPQASTALPGDFATALTTESSTTTGSSTTVGAANLTAQGRSMTVLGAANGPSGPDAVPDGATVVGSGNAVGSPNAVKIGFDHPASEAGDGHTVIGTGNIAQQNGLPWAGPQVPVAIGAATTLSGDPSDAASSAEWFGGCGPLAAGRNDPSFDPCLITLSGNVASQVVLRVGGDATIGSHHTYAATSNTLGFFSATGITRPQIPISSGDVVNDQLTAVLTILAQAGLIYTAAVPILTESGTHPDGSYLEFAETGQALQWKLPPTSADYRAANAFTVASNQVVLNSALAPFPSHGLAALYSCGRADVAVEGRFSYSTATSSFPDADLYTGLMVRSSMAQSLSGGQPVAVVTGYLVGRQAVYAMSGDTVTSTVTTLSTSPAAGDLLRAECSGTSVIVKVNGVTAATFADSTFNTKVKDGFRLMPGTGASQVKVYPFGF